MEPVQAKQDDVAHKLGGSDVKPDSLSSLYGVWRRPKQFEVAIEHRRRLEKTWHGKHHSTLDVGKLDALKVQRRSLAGTRLSGCMPVNLNAADARRALSWKDFDLLLLLHAACDKRACHDSSESFHRETAVHRQTKDVIHVSGSDPADEVLQRVDEPGNTLPCEGTDA
jgi:hypothetical protein